VLKRLIIKKIIVYNILLVAVAIISEVLAPESERKLLIAIMESLLPLAIFAILIDIGRSIENAKIRKKYALYTSILVGESLLIVFISKIFDVSTENSLLGTIGVNVIFVTLIVMLHKIAGYIKKTHEGMGCFLKIVIAFLIFGVVINNILFFAL